MFIFTSFQNFKNENFRFLFPRDTLKMQNTYVLHVYYRIVAVYNINSRLLYIIFIYIYIKDNLTIK